MLDENYREAVGRVGPNDAQMERLWGRLERAEGRRARPVLRTALIAAAICAVLVTTVAAAYFMGAFDFIKAREEYQFLGRSEVYEKYAKIVNLTQTAENGDILTIERMAMDESFCVFFYTVQTQKKMPTYSEYNAGISPDAPDLWQTLWSAPRFILVTNEGAVSGENQQEQQFLSEDGYTLYGMVRVNLLQSLSRGEDYTLNVLPSYREESNAVKWSFDLTAAPVKTETVSLNQSATVFDGGENHEITLLSLARSPLGTVLQMEQAIPEEYRSNPGLWDFSMVFRNADTGDYLPFSWLESTYTDEARSARHSVVEFYGDLSDLRTLELVPAQRGESQFVTAPLSELPAQGSVGNGGYEVSSVEIKEGQIVVTTCPVGIVSYVNGYSDVQFLDASGERLFRSEEPETTYVSQFTDWTDGSRIWTYSLGGVSQEYVARIAQIQFLWSTYDILEDQAVSIPLQ